MVAFPYIKGVIKRFKHRSPNYNVSASKTHNQVVPEGKIWEILNVACHPDTSATAYVTLIDSEGSTLTYIITSGATTGVLSGPTDNLGNAASKPLIALEGDYINMALGANQAGADYLSITVIEYDARELRERRG